MVGASWQKIWRDWILSFDGVDDYVLVADNSSLRITDKITVMVWVYPFDVSSWHAFLTGKAYTYFLAVFGGTIRWYLGNGSNWFLIEANVSLSANAWTHIAATYDSSTGVYQVFKNGVLARSGSVTPQSIAVNDRGVSIGRCYPPTPIYYPFSGLIGEARIFRKVLSSAQISALYNLFRGELRKPPT